MTKNPGFYEAQYDYGVRSKLVDAELLKKHKALIVSYEKTSKECNQLESTVADQTKKMAKLEEDGKLLSKKLRYYEQFKVRLVKETGSHIQVLNNLKAQMGELQARIEVKPQRLADLSLVMAPNIQKLLAGVLDQRFGGPNLKEIGVEQAFLKLKDEIKELVEQLEKERSDNIQLKAELESPIMFEKRKNISRKERLSPAQTRKSTMPISVNKFSAKVESDSRGETPDVLLSPTKSLSPNFKFATLDPKKNISSFSKLAEDGDTRGGLLRAQTFKHRDRNNEDYLETIQEDKSPILSDPSINRNGEISERISISDGDDEVVVTTKEMEKQRALQTLSAELEDVKETVKSLTANIESCSKELTEVYNYIQGFSPVYFED